MKNFWKLVVFACLFMQFGFAHNASKHTTANFQKKSENTFSKKSISAFQFVRPTIERGTSDLKHNNRIPVGFSYCPTEYQFSSILSNNDLKIALSDQDIDRCNKVSILLFPFHYFW